MPEWSQILTEATKESEIFSAMTNAGLIIPGKDPRNNLSAMLSNSDEFVSTSAGWVRAGSALAPKVAGAADASTSAAPKSGVDTPGNQTPQGVMSYAGGGEISAEKLRHHNTLETFPVGGFPDRAFIA